VTRDQLEHAIRAACDVAQDHELIIFGSQAILGEYPDAPPALRASTEVDVQPKNRPEAVDRIDGALGELSPFNELHGFYVQGVLIDIAILPLGWEDRTIPVSNENTRGNTGYCLEAHDLAASKLAAFWEKDRHFVRVLLIEALVDVDVLRARISNLPVPPETRDRLLAWVERTVDEL
jgi:hypothetical protein